MVIGEGNVSLCIGGIYFDLLVVIVDDLKFDLLLGDEFLREENFVIDYREQVLRVHGAEIDFEPLPSECVATLSSVVEIPVGTPLRVRADLSGNHCGLVLLWRV